MKCFVLFLAASLVCNIPLFAQQNANSAGQMPPPVPGNVDIGTPVESADQPVPIEQPSQQDIGKPVEIDPQAIDIPPIEHQMGASVSQSVFSPDTIPSQALLDSPDGQPLPRHTITLIPDNVLIPNSLGSTDGWTPSEVAVFEGPCHFPYKQSCRSTGFSGDSLLIYEGMRVLVDDKGAFEVSFTAEVPDIPVVLSLTLGIHKAETGDLVGTITLPPIVFETDASYSRHQASHTVRVTRKGFSRTLQRMQSVAAKPQGGAIKQRLVFTRQGNGRFGSIPPRGDYSIATSADAASIQ